MTKSLQVKPEKITAKQRPGHFFVPAAVLEFIRKGRTADDRRV